MRWLEFFQDPRGDYSMTRLLALLCCLAGCYVAVKSPQEWQTITALIGGGAVALATRWSGPDGPSQTSK